jgi:hypothetical protein
VWPKLRSIWVFNRIPWQEVVGVFVRFRARFHTVWYFGLAVLFSPKYRWFYVLLLGVYMQVSGERTTFVATDGHRIRYRREDVLRKIPRRAGCLVRLLIYWSLRFQSGSSRCKKQNSNSIVRFSFDYQMVSRLIDEALSWLRKHNSKESNKMLIRQEITMRYQRIAVTFR